MSKELIKSYREMTLIQLQKNLHEKKYSLIRNKMEFSFGKNKVHTNINKLKKEIAKIQTVISDIIINNSNSIKETDVK